MHQTYIIMEANTMNPDQTAVKHGCNPLELFELNGLGSWNVLLWISALQKMFKKRP